MAIHGKMHEFAIMAQIREFRKSDDGCKNYSLNFAIRCQMQTYIPKFFRVKFSSKFVKKVFIVDPTTS